MWSFRLTTDLRQKPSVLQTPSWQIESFPESIVPEQFLKNPNSVWFGFPESRHPSTIVSGFEFPENCPRSSCMRTPQTQWRSWIDWYPYDIIHWYWYDINCYLDDINCSKIASYSKCTSIVDRKHVSISRYFLENQIKVCC